MDELDVRGTPYFLSGGSGGAAAMRQALEEIAARVSLLRTQGTLTADTLHDYYGEKRFEQIAESNAIEGSTLSAGETELAVVKGITISGHDPAFSRDARSLARALEELVALARQPAPTDLTQLKRLHELILGDRPGAGTFRTQEVRISGSAHVPPRTWQDVMAQMEQWEQWSVRNPNTAPALRAVVLHAWLAHIHPFIDGNGRVARAITNLELIRAGYPPIIVRKKDRDQYIDALAESDQGLLGPLLELIAGRIEDALRDLERAAARRQGYDAQREQVRRAQAQRLALWNAGVHLLFEQVRSTLGQRFDGSAVRIDMREHDQLGVDDFIDLCEGHPVRNSWAFRIRCQAPGMPELNLLAWAGTPGPLLNERLAAEPGRPALMWSLPNPNGYPPWVRTIADAPGGDQLTILGDRWLVSRAGQLHELAPSELAARIADDIAAKLVPAPTL